MRRAFAAFIVFAGFVTAGVLAAIVFDESAEGRSLIAESFSRDRLGALAAIIIAGAGALTVLVSWGENRRDHGGEYYALLAAAGAGMAFFVTAGNLMTLFLGLEWFSISLYILCALDTHRETSLEAGLKYLIVGSFGSAILLFGSALVYGATGELGFGAIADAKAGDDYLLLAGLAMLIAGLGFKASAAPFHMWTPDVYEGAPTSVTAFMAAATKVAALVLTLRILVVGFPEQEHLWTIAIAVLACVSLAVGNLAALVQRNVKRLLAYSSVSHAGFMLIAIAANSELGATALLYYLIPYGAMSIGAFAVVAARERELGVPVTLDNLAGFGWERPFLGAAMWVFMLGFMGMPLHRGPRRQVLRLLRGVRIGLVVADHRGRDRHGDLALLLPRCDSRPLPAARARPAAGGRGRFAAARPAAPERSLRLRWSHGRLVHLRAAVDRPGARRRVEPALLAKQRTVTWRGRRRGGARAGRPTSQRAAPARRRPRGRRRLP